jgi:hypothetical protein
MNINIKMKKKVKRKVLHDYAACPCGMSFGTPILHAKAACPGFMSMLHFHPCLYAAFPEFTLHAHAACPRCMSKELVSAEDPFCMTCGMKMLHEHVA